MGKGALAVQWFHLEVSGQYNEVNAVLILQLLDQVVRPNLRIDTRQLFGSRVRQSGDPVL